METASLRNHLNTVTVAVLCKTEKLQIIVFTIVYFTTMKSYNWQFVLCKPYMFIRIPNVPLNCTENFLVKVPL